MNKEIRENLIKAIASGNIEVIKAEAKNMSTLQSYEKDGVTVLYIDSFLDALKITSWLNPLTKEERSKYLVIETENFKNDFWTNIAKKHAEVEEKEKRLSSPNEDE